VTHSSAAPASEVAEFSLLATGALSFAGESEDSVGVLFVQAPKNDINSNKLSNSAQIVFLSFYFSHSF
jgi:hypothetical protein